MRRLAVAAVLVLTVLPSPAHASTGCVTNAEYHSAPTGYTRDYVEQVFGTTGTWVKRWTRSDDTEWLVKRYPACRASSWSWVKVRYMALSGPFIVDAKWHS